MATLATKANSAPLINTSLPRGIRNNNPGNIRRTTDQWEGMKAVQTDPVYVEFTHPKYGFRAMTRVLRNYQKIGITTVRDMINRWAPNTENPTGNYVNFVADKLGQHPDAEVNLTTQLLPLIKAIVAFENGSSFINYYSDTTINEGIALA